MGGKNTPSASGNKREFEGREDNVVEEVGSREQDEDRDEEDGVEVNDEGVNLSDVNNELEDAHGRDKDKDKERPRARVALGRAKRGRLNE